MKLWELGRVAWDGASERERPRPELYETCRSNKAGPEQYKPVLWMIELKNSLVLAQATT